jgi:hypothetical protein
VDRALRVVARALRLAVQAFPWALGIVFFAPAFFVASVVPYRFYDSLAFGTWSRLIADRGHLWFPNDLFDSQAGRPLFYVGQGLVWLAFGYHEWLGRWFSGLIDVLLVVCLYVLGSRLTADRSARDALRPVAVGTILAASAFATFVTEGLTDLPVAAMSALTAVFLWSRRLGRIRLPLVALAAAATILAKPTGIVAVVGLALAALVDALGADGRRRTAESLAALAAGTVLGLAYDAVMARRFDETLIGFVKAGGFQHSAASGSHGLTSYDWLAAVLVFAAATGIAYAILRCLTRDRRLTLGGGGAIGIAVAAVAVSSHGSSYFSRLGGFRWDAALSADWLGTGVALIVVYGIVYGVARALGARTRLAAAVAAPLALLWAVGGQALARKATPYPFDQGFGTDLVAWLLLAATIVVAPFLPEREVVSRRVFVRLVLWAAPGGLAWFAYRPDQARFLGPVWPPLVLLGAAALGSALVALTAAARPAVLVPAAALTLLVVANVVNIDGLGSEQWSALQKMGTAGWGSKPAMENFAYGPFSYALDATRVYAGPADRVLSTDGRLAYFFPGRTDVGYPGSCSRLQGHRVFVLLTSGEAGTLEDQVGSADPLAWIQCKLPPVSIVDEQTGINATFVVGLPPSPAPDPSACHVSSYAGQLDDGVFAAGVRYAEARQIATRAASVGFASAKVERTGCSSFHVVVTGIPPDKGEDFRREAAKAGFRVAIVPAVRYPEVPVNVEAVG